MRDPKPATPNHALERTVPHVTLAAIYVCGLLVRAGPLLFFGCHIFVSPSQPSRRAPRSLSLRSLIWLSCLQLENGISSLLGLE